MMQDNIQMDDDGGCEDVMNLFKMVCLNIVQLICVFCVVDLVELVVSLGQYFLYVNCVVVIIKSEVFDVIVCEFLFLKYFGKNFDVLVDCLIDMIYKVGLQLGFVIVLEGLLC